MTLPWQRGREILRSAVADMDKTRHLRQTLEILQGTRRDDPAHALLLEHAKDTSEEVSALRALREALREAAQREMDEMNDFTRRLK